MIYDENFVFFLAVAQLKRTYLKYKRGRVTLILILDLSLRLTQILGLRFGLGLTLILALILMMSKANRLAC